VVEEVVVGSPATAAADPVAVPRARVPQAHDRATGSDTDDLVAVADVRSPRLYAVAVAGSSCSWGAADDAWWCAADVTCVAVARSSGKLTRKFPELPKLPRLSPTLH